jgi:thioredoxin 2
MSQTLDVVCPHCDTTNRVPSEKLAAGGRCGVCQQPLFEGRPVSLDGARFQRHFDHSDIPLLSISGRLGVGLVVQWPRSSSAPRGALEPGVRLVKVNIDEEPALAEQFGVRSIPTIVLALGGREINRLNGARSEADLVGWVLRQQAVRASA